jgi:hypothetical protein
VKTCMEAVSSRVISRDSRKGAVIEAWAHAGVIAGFSALWAEINNMGIDSSEAYLVGLFHELGSLPTLLGWDSNAWRTQDVHSMGLRIAAQCSLPRCVREYFSETMVLGPNNRWWEIVDGAHQLASQPSIESNSERQSSIYENHAS